MNKIAIYTALIGNYDSIHQPSTTDDRFDYFLFTDDVTESQAGVWQIRKVDYTNKDSTRVARYVKTHPHALLPDYKATLWIDASIEIVSPYIYERCIEMMKIGVQLASIKHPWRDCIYDEAFVVYGLEEERKIMSWCHKLRIEGYPRHNGLYESGVLFRTNDEDIIQFNDDWWNIILHYTRRDQLGLNYLLWNKQIKQDYILPQGEHVANSVNIRIRKHNNSSQLHGRRGIKESFWEHARCRCRGGMKEKTEQFKNFHYWLYGLNPIVAKVLLHLWGMYATLVYGTIIKIRAYKKHKNET
ncbi:MAG: DUF616 domain-containing protein [Paludibacteraceae bacterium]|nr:DUF616 domain-containing protein [Paludibacteraceae bacterium]